MRSVNVGDSIEALILQKEDKEGRLVLSKKRAQYERAWGTIEEIEKREGVVSGPVIEVVKGGLIVDIGLRGFLPASLVELRRVRDLQPYVGQTLEAKIIELDKNRNNVVLSRRAFLEETQKEQREDFLANLAPGEVRSGVVSSVVNFGAFVDLGGMDGLIHVSELSWKHVDHPGSVVAVGDEVTVQVLEVDLERERISLSLKATQQDPWQEFATSHRVGELVYGRVTKLVPFGSFVQVGDGIEWIGPHLGDVGSPRRPARASCHSGRRALGSRSLILTCSVVGSLFPSSRPPKVASLLRNTRSTSVTTPLMRKETTSARPMSIQPLRQPGAEYYEDLEPGAEGAPSAEATGDSSDAAEASTEEAPETPAEEVAAELTEEAPAEEAAAEVTEEVVEEAPAEEAAAEATEEAVEEAPAEEAAAEATEEVVEEAPAEEAVAEENND